MDHHLRRLRQVALETEMSEEAARYIRALERAVGGLLPTHPGIIYDMRVATYTGTVGEPYTRTMEELSSSDRLILSGNAALQDGQTYMVEIDMVLSIHESQEIICPECNGGQVFDPIQGWTETCPDCLGSGQMSVEAISQKLRQILVTCKKEGYRYLII